MGQVHIRSCAPEDLDAVLRLERAWAQEDIAYGNFNPMNWEMFREVLERFPARLPIEHHTNPMLLLLYPTLPQSRNLVSASTAKAR